ncbi:MAG: PQQ-binding-like beta-propeller repeat protein [Clostridiales bacterium]|nr:PQQ-binding-like beta-propeller repeat protein [Clostridiales bacterium]
MSDLFDGKTNVSADEPTKTMPAVDAQAQPTVRHRRSDRKPQSAEKEEVKLTGSDPVRGAEEKAGSSEQPRSVQPGSGQTFRIPPQNTAQTASDHAGNVVRASVEERKTQTTPRPKALDRTNPQGSNRPQASGKTQRPSDIRRPVNAPGYTRQEPLGKAYDVPAQKGNTPVREAKPVQEETTEKRGIAGGLIALLIVVLVIALLVMGYFLIPNDAEGILGDAKRSVNGMISGIVGAEPTAAPEEEKAGHVVSYYVNTENMYAPTEANFYLVTDPSVSDVRLFDAEGQILDGIASSESTEDGKTQWTISVSFEQPYWGMISPQVYTTEWEETGMKQEISIREETVMETSTVAPTMMVVSDILDFSASPSQGTAPVNIAFSMTTNLNITRVRLVYENGEPLDAEPAVLIDNASTRIWALNYNFESAYSGTIRAQANIDDVWMDSNKLVTLSINGGSSTAAPTVSPAPAPAEEIPEEEQVLDDEDVIVVDDLDDSDAVYDMPEDWDGGMEEPEENTDDIPEEPASYATQAPLVDNAIAALPLVVSPTPPVDMGMDDTVIVDEEVIIEETAEATPAPTEVPAPSEVPEAMPRLVAQADESAAPSLIKSAVIYNGTKKAATYSRDEKDIVNMPDADTYARQPYGVMTFRGSSFRQNAAEGTVENISEMEVLWKVDASSVKGSGKTVFYGIGWTGQPLIIKWSKEVRELANILQEKKDTKALREVILAGEDGKIYFLDLETGEKTRETIDLGYPMRGTPSVHALGYPVMSVGQYARKMAKKTGDIGMRVYNLLNSKQAFMIDGLDGKLERPYYEVGSFETSSLIDYNSDTMITAGTNGMLYLTKLNTAIDRGTGTLTLNPSHVSVKTKASGESDKQVAVESSMAAYQNYVFYADMGGVLRCVDTTTLTTVWAVKTGDAVEAAVALDLSDDGNTLWLYTANTLTNRSKGDCQIRRYNAMTGAMDWEYSLPVKKNKKTTVTPGVKASPVIGRNGLDELVYFTASYATDIDGTAAEGVLLAINKETGKLAWSRPLSSYSYSSPVAVYNEEGKGWIIQASHSGVMELLDGLTGAVVSRLQIDGEINASPAVYKSTLVIGTQGKGTSSIYGISLK